MMICCFDVLLVGYDKIKWNMIELYICISLEVFMGGGGGVVNGFLLRWVLVCFDVLFLRERVII